jgi:hypothetical protein
VRFPIPNAGGSGPAIDGEVDTAGMKQATCQVEQNKKTDHECQGPQVEHGFLLVSFLIQPRSVIATGMPGGTAVAKACKHRSLRYSFEIAINYKGGRVCSFQWV